MTVKNSMHEAILTAMDTVIFPRIEMTVKSITGSLRHGHQSVVKNPDRGDSTMNTKLLRSSQPVAVAAHLRSLRADNSLNKGHPRPIKQQLEL